MTKALWKPLQDPNHSRHPGRWKTWTLQNEAARHQKRGHLNGTPSAAASWGDPAVGWKEGTRMDSYELWMPEARPPKKDDEKQNFGHKLWRAHVFSCGKNQHQFAKGSLYMLTAHRYVCVCAKYSRTLNLYRNKAGGRRNTVKRPLSWAIYDHIVKYHRCI